MNKDYMILLVVTLTFLMLAPQALALTSSFGGSSNSGSTDKSESMILRSSDSFASQDTLSFGSGVSMDSSGTVSLESEDGSVKEYHDVVSGKLYAATYAYMDEPGSYSYSYSKSASASAVKMSEKLTATDATHLLYGGFAYNDKNYAAVQVWGDAGSVNYQNSLSATDSRARASQSLSAVDADLDIASWAERGNKGNEAQNQETIEANLNDERYGPAPLGDDTVLDLAAEQQAHIVGTIKSHKSDASIDSGAATASQSADIPEAMETSFYGGSARGKHGYGMTELGVANWVYADTSAETGPGKNIIFKDNSKSTKSDVTASITQLKIKNTHGAKMYASAVSNIGYDNYYADEEESAYNYHYATDDMQAMVLANMKGTASAIAKNGYASVAQTMDASNADEIYKGASASSWDAEDGNSYFASSGSSVYSFIPVVMENMAITEASQEIMASMKGSDSATAKNDYASVTQAMDAKGGRIYRDIGTGKAMMPASDGYNSGEGVYADTTLFDGFWIYDLEFGYNLILPQPAAASRLNGKSTAIDTAKGASLSGSWSVNLAKDLTDYSAYDMLGIPGSFRRYAYAYNGNDFDDSSAAKSSVNNARAFSFKESASKNNKEVNAS